MSIIQSNRFLFILAFFLFMPLTGYCSLVTQGAIYVVTQAEKSNNQNTKEFLNKLDTYSSDVEIHLISIEQLMKNTAQLKDADAIVTLGPFALKFMLELDLKKPLVSVFVSRTLYELISSDFPDNNWVTAVFADPDPGDQLGLISGIYPQNHAVIGVLISENTKLYRYSIELAAKVSNIEVVFEVIDEMNNPIRSIKRAIVQLRKQGAVSILAIPDYKIYNNDSLRDIFITAFRNKLSIIGFSKELVKLGAVASVYYEADHFAISVFDIYRNYSDNHMITAPSFSRNFNIAINRTIAESLSLYKTDSQELLTRIQKNSQMSDKAFRFVYLDTEHGKDDRLL